MMVNPRIRCPASGLHPLSQPQAVRGSYTAIILPMDQQHGWIAAIDMGHRLSLAQIIGWGKDALQYGVLEGKKIIGSSQAHHATDGLPRHPDLLQKRRIQSEHGRVICTGRVTQQNHCRRVASMTGDMTVCPSHCLRSIFKKGG